MLSIKIFCQIIHVACLLYFCVFVCYIVGVLFSFLFVGSVLLLSFFVFGICVCLFCVGFFVLFVFLGCFVGVFLWGLIFLLLLLLLLLLHFANALHG